MTAYFSYTLRMKTLFLWLLRLSASESLINGHITAATCGQCGLVLPAVCDCDDKRNSCGRRKGFRASPSALFDAPAALSCYANTSRSVGLRSFSSYFI